MREAHCPFCHYVAHRCAIIPDRQLLLADGHGTSVVYDKISAANRTNPNVRSEIDWGINFVVRRRRVIDSRHN
jgi:hypothetical protein